MGESGLWTQRDHTCTYHSKTNYILVGIRLLYCLILRDVRTKRCSCSSRKRWWSWPNGEVPSYPNFTCYYGFRSCNQVFNRFPSAIFKTIISIRQCRLNCTVLFPMFIFTLNYIAYDYFWLHWDWSNLVQNSRNNYILKYILFDANINWISCGHTNCLKIIIHCNCTLYNRNPRSIG